MASVIKAADPAVFGRVRLASLGPPEPPGPSVVELERDSLAKRLEALTAELESRDRRIAELESDAAEAYAKGEADGRATGREEGAECARETLALLDEGVREALNQSKQELAALDRLAVEIARTALAKLVGDEATHADLIVRIVREQLRNLEADAIVSVEVATCDFADPEALARLAEAAQKPGAAIRRRPDLPAGACRIRLTLGALEVGLDQQWRRLETLFDELSEWGRAA